MLQKTARLRKELLFLFFFNHLAKRSN